MTLKKIFIIYILAFIGIMFFLPRIHAMSVEKESEMKEIVKILNQVYSRTDGMAKDYIKKEYFVGEDYRFPIELSEQEWKKRLTKEQYYILREEGTERAFTGEYDKNYEKGIYYSAASGHPIFSSEDKYNSQTGWPSFTKSITPGAVLFRIDKSLFSTRIEVLDTSGSHLGHVFEDGPAPTGLRFCMNSRAMIFVPEGGTPPEPLTINN